MCSRTTCGPRPHGDDRDDRRGKRDHRADGEARVEPVDVVLGGERARLTRVVEVRSDDRAHHRDPERAADLAEAVEDARADARLVHRHGSHRGRRSSATSSSPSRRRRGSSTAAASRSPSGQLRARRAEARWPTSVIPPPISQREPTRSDSRPAIGAMRMISVTIGRNDRSRLRRRVAEDVLDVERDEEEDAEHRERDEHRHDVRAGERADLEEREVEHRQPLPLLDHDERDEAGPPPARRDRGSRASVQPWLFPSTSA